MARSNSKACGTRGYPVLVVKRKPRRPKKTVLEPFKCRKACRVLNLVPVDRYCCSDVETVASLGENCSNSNTHCDGNLVCDDNTCKKDVGDDCSGADECRNSTVCKDEKCKRPKYLNESCRDNNTYCNGTLVCDDNQTCSIKVGGDCSNPEGCEAGETCVLGTCLIPKDVITSPNFPDKYTDFAHEEWNITAPTGHKVAVLFTHFDLEITTGCPYDDSSKTPDEFFADYNYTYNIYAFDDERILATSCICDSVQFFDGNSSDAAMTVCGQGIPDIFVSNSNAVRMLFKSDTRIVCTGFRAEVFYV